MCLMKYTPSYLYIASINIGVCRPYWPEHHLVAELWNKESSIIHQVCGEEESCEILTAIRASSNVLKTN